MAAAIPMATRPTGAIRRSAASTSTTSRCGPTPSSMRPTTKRSSPSARTAKCPAGSTAVSDFLLDRNRRAPLRECAPRHKAISEPPSILQATATDRTLFTARARRRAATTMKRAASGSESSRSMRGQASPRRTVFSIGDVFFDPATRLGSVSHSSPAIQLRISTTSSLSSRTQKRTRRHPCSCPPLAPARRAGQLTVMSPWPTRAGIAS